MEVSKKLNRIFTVHNHKIPDLSDLNYIYNEKIILSVSKDSLKVELEYYYINNNNKFFISFTDISGNKLSYETNESNYYDTKQLLNKNDLKFKSYNIKSSFDSNIDIIIEVYDHIIIAKYYSDNYSNLQSLPLEDWFKSELTETDILQYKIYNG